MEAVDIVVLRFSIPNLMYLRRQAYTCMCLKLFSHCVVIGIECFDLVVFLRNVRGVLYNIHIFDYFKTKVNDFNEVDMCTAFL